MNAANEQPMRAVVVEALGGPDVLQVREAPRPVPTEGETLVRVTLAGVNYTDLGQRERGWGMPRRSLPIVPGWEVAGVRAEDGVRVAGLLPMGTGGYAEYASVPNALCIPIPDGLDDGAALAVLMQGLTAWHLLASAARIRPGETVAVTAAAGGVGTLAIQLAPLMGASRVIAVASTERKRALTLELGADAATRGDAEGFAGRLLAANNGDPVDIVLESVAGPILDAALEAVAFGGRLVAYGQASGAVNHVSVDDLMDRSIGVIGYWARPHMQDEAGSREILVRLLAHASTGRLRPVVGPTFPLDAASAAHEAIASRSTAGKVTLTVGEGEVV